ncbi:ABC transporter permease [Actinomyces bowdenii]|uniref:ABC transporter permease n=1 Tax=Actinomyces bowdenii TaxID=131109 RepID=UPI00214B3C4A|nr:ABC transporter permease [Actinomyces bowdenii]MCR2053735.1 ABC transporter permease [Actinomyces bowdenii]
MSEIIGALVEAWGQVRVGKLRVLLSLVGVAAAVASMTFVIAFGEISVYTIQEYLARFSGEPGTVSLTVSPTKADEEIGAPADAGGADGTGGSGGADGGRGSALQAGPGGAAGGDPVTANRQTEKISAAMDTFVDRYQVTYAATTYQIPLRLAFPDGPAKVDTTAVSGQYEQIHRSYADQGRWLNQDDADDLSPSLVVSPSVLQRLGIEMMDGPVTVESYLPTRVTFTIVGVLPAEPQQYDANGSPVPEPLTAFVLRDSLEPLLPKDFTRPSPTLELWVGKSGDAEMRALVRNDFNAQFGAGSAQVRSNLEGQGGVDSSSTFTRVVTISGLFVMILGALSLVNISLVTVRQRINEIGVRRSFGATSQRIFFSIMLESVVATVLAGIVGIAIAVVGIQVVPLAPLLGIEPHVRPPFPMTAALIGLLSATGVGALAGIIPAIVAVRIRPIDAIRY